jgi:hypothetical protein
MVEISKRTYRMYGMVPYQLSGIQAGIQFGHATVEYGNEFQTLGKEYIDAGVIDGYDQWRHFDKTFIVLNGGTFNKRFVKVDKMPEWADAARDNLGDADPRKRELYAGKLPLGSMDRYALELECMGVPIARFYEPDANDGLLAFCFLVDDRVFDQLRDPDLKRQLRDLNKRGVDLNDFQMYLDQFGSRENFYLALFLVDKELARN